MSANMYRNQLTTKRKQLLDAEKRAREYRAKESQKRTDAAKARQAAAKTTSESTAKSKLQEANRRDSDAASAGKSATEWDRRATRYAKEASDLVGKVAKAEQAEAQAAQKKADRARAVAERRATAARQALESRVAHTELSLADARLLPAPKVEKLRILFLGASPERDLRMAREQKRIQDAVRSALHRDRVEIHSRPAATADDLLDALSQFRPHVLHFSGHSSEEAIVFEHDVDFPHEGLVVSAGAFANAVGATDTRPLLVLLNSCHSAAQLEHLVESVVPLAIGMADKIDDGDAIQYAARFYAAVANGESIHSAHLQGKVALEMAGLSGTDLPTLVSAANTDPITAVLVEPD